MDERHCLFTAKERDECDYIYTGNASNLVLLTRCGVCRHAIRQSLYEAVKNREGALYHAHHATSYTVKVLAIWNLKDTHAMIRLKRSLFMYIFTTQRVSCWLVNPRESPPVVSRAHYFAWRRTIQTELRVASSSVLHRFINPISKWYPYA